VYGNATFTKQTGGVIYGSEDEANHNSASEGQAVYISSSPAKVRNDTAFSHVTLDSAVSGSAGGWEDPAPAPSATVQVSLVPMADDPALTDVSLFANEAAQFSTDSGYASWAWYWNGEPISGASASTYTITANSKTPGIYELSVVVTTSAGETLSAWCKVVVKTN
jgi:hypothetical protein